jgi:two-component system NtrC family sensor kinase
MEGMEKMESLDGQYDRIKASDVAKKALLARKRLSLRLQICASFFVVFLVAAIAAYVLSEANTQVEKKLNFLEIANDFTVEIIQARRFEKNFFLYDTNLDDALENVYQARTIFDKNTGELEQVLGRDNYNKMMSGLDHYGEILEHLLAQEKGNRLGNTQEANKEKMEIEVRKSGRKLVVLAQDLMERERNSLSKMLNRSRQLHLYSLIFLLVFLAANASFLVSRILVNVNRFTVYAQRIASGDFTPITPARRYRDEFTELALAINQMIEELENREAVLVQSHKMRAVGTLTAGVAHELNNPLNNITLTAHMLLEDYEELDEDEKKDMIKDVVKESDRSKKIISNLLDFARESSSELEPLALEELLEGTIALALNQIKLSGIKIEFQSAGNLPRVHGDGQQLQQVFLNLILNAIDASPKGSKIEVLVLPADDPTYIAVKVIDSGSGIPEHILHSIFDPFFTTKPKGSGTGLGLSVSQGIVAKHGGRIRAASQEGKGATFTVTLPITTIPALIEK